ncbi:MAG: TetR/AcrR family transcriptional regulator [Nannocystaceae bacterium]
MGTQRSDEQRKRQIRSAATRCFVRRGYDATRLLDIANEAGLSKGGVYFHYRAKQQIFDEILELQLREIRARWSFDPGAREPADRCLAALIVAQLRSTEEDPEQTRMFNLLVTMAAQDPAFRRQLGEAVAIVHRLYAKMIRRGIDEGLFVDEDASQLASSVLAAVTGLGALSALHDRGSMPVPPEQAADAIVRMVMRSPTCTAVEFGSPPPRPIPN